MEKELAQTVHDGSGAWQIFAKGGSSKESHGTLLFLFLSLLSLRVRVKRPACPPIPPPVLLTWGRSLGEGKRSAQNPETEQK